MPVTAEQIDVWRKSATEHQRLEFKEAKQQFDFRKLCRYCVALANEGGGTLLFGIADKPPRDVVGTKACLDPISQAQALLEEVGFRVDIEEVAHPRKANQTGSKSTQGRSWPHRISLTC